MVNERQRIYKKSDAQKFCQIVYYAERDLFGFEYYVNLKTCLARIPHQKFKY